MIHDVFEAAAAVERRISTLSINTKGFVAVRATTGQTVFYGSNLLTETFSDSYIFRVATMGGNEEIIYLKKNN